MNIFLLILGPIVGVAIIFIYRYFIGFPFPWETTPDKLQNPDSSGVKKCFNNLKDSDYIDIVMGEMNSEIVNEKEVVGSLKKALERDIEIKMIVGPEFDKRSETFAEQLLKSERARVYQLKQRPIYHFRIINDKDLFIEPYHQPLTGSRYWSLRNVKGFARQYKKIFNKYLNDSKEIFKITDFSSVR